LRFFNNLDVEDLLAPHKEDLDDENCEDSIEDKVLFLVP
jgi:hypothetical protein